MIYLPIYLSHFIGTGANDIVHYKSGYSHKRKYLFDFSPQEYWSPGADILTWFN